MDIGDLDMDEYRVYVASVCDVAHSFEAPGAEL